MISKGKKIASHWSFLEALLKLPVGLEGQYHMGSSGITEGTPSLCHHLMKGFANTYSQSIFLFLFLLIFFFSLKNHPNTRNFFGLLFFSPQPVTLALSRPVSNCMQLQAHECAPAENCALIKLGTHATERKTASFLLHSAIKALCAPCCATLRVTVVVSADIWGGLEEDEATQVWALSQSLLCQTAFLAWKLLSEVQ